LYLYIIIIIIIIIKSMEQNHSCEANIHSASQ
jgi:hypothetical protein